MKQYDKYLEREENGEWKPKAKKRKYVLYIPPSDSIIMPSTRRKWLFTNNSGQRVIGKYVTKRDAEKALASEMKNAKCDKFSMYTVEDLEQAVIEKI